MQQAFANQFFELGELAAIDGSLFNAILFMTWADYRRTSEKAKAHLGFDINRSIPQLFLTEGKGGEWSFVGQVLEVGQTRITDWGCQCNKTFDQLQREPKHFVCCNKVNTAITCIESYTVPDNSIVFYDAQVRIGLIGGRQTDTSLHPVGYRVGGKEYWMATDRFDPSAEQITQICTLRWAIEKFFAWWKRRRRVYHLISRSPHGLITRIFYGLIAYLLLAVYCRQQHGKTVSIKRVRKLRRKILNECRAAKNHPPDGAPQQDVPPEVQQAIP